MAVSILKAVAWVCGKKRYFVRGWGHQNFWLLYRYLQQEIACQEEQAPTDPLCPDRLRVMDRELAAAIAMARGDAGAAIAQAQEASCLEPRALEGLAEAQERLGREAEARYNRAKLEQIRAAGDRLSTPTSP